MIESNQQYIPGYTVTGLPLGEAVAMPESVCAADCAYFSAVKAITWSSVSYHNYGQVRVN